MGLWFALEDASEVNGCLWVRPGSHMEGVARKWVRRDEGGFDYQDIQTASSRPLGGVPLAVRAGTLVVLHDTLFHCSGVNDSEGYREAYALHLMDGRSQFESTNWLQRLDEDPFRGF